MWLKVLVSYKKYICLALMIFILGICGCAKQEDGPLVFSVNNVEDAETGIYAWQDEEGIYHVFLPSFCEMSDVSLKTNKNQKIVINGEKINKRKTMEGFSLDETYDLEMNGQKSFIQFHHSENVAALFIDTQSGTMDAIHADKEYRESASAILIDKEGKLNYSTNECSLKGRGNSTWLLFDKKPYQLKLEDAADLLNMGSAKKWILLANAFDETNLRNKLVYDMARETGICYAPECEYIDLYLNGEYRGLYLLAERVEFGEDRLALDAEEEYMFNVEPRDRWDTLENAVQTAAKRALEIREPDEPSEDEMEHILGIMQAMEDAILSPDESTELEKVIDIESWCYKYLIDEITENGDADIASSYYYYADGKVYGGPLWDYDNSLGVSTKNQNPRTFLARSGSYSVGQNTPYYDALYKRDVFYEKMVELYCETVRPSIVKLIETDIWEKEEIIKSATAMNRIRWKAGFDERDSAIKDVSGIAEYLEQRLQFLDSAWIDGEEYYTVQFEPYVIAMYATKDTYPGSYAVKKGESLSDLDIPVITDIENTVWVDAKTGEEFHSDQVLTKNITLKLIER